MWKLKRPLGSIGLVSVRRRQINSFWPLFLISKSLVKRSYIRNRKNATSTETKKWGTIFTSIDVDDDDDDDDDCDHDDDDDDDDADDDGERNSARVGRSKLFWQPRSRCVGEIRPNLFGPSLFNPNMFGPIIFSPKLFFKPPSTTISSHLMK